MADTAPAWAQDAPDWAKPKPALKAAAPAPAWAAPPQHGASGDYGKPGLVAGVLDTLENVGDSVAAAVRGMPAARRQAQDEQAQIEAREQAAAKEKPFGGVRQAASEIGSDISGALQRQVLPEARAFESDTTRPLSTKHPMLDAAARVPEAAWHAFGTAFGIPSSVITGIAGRDVQAKTGIDKDLAGGLLVGGTHPTKMPALPAFVHEAQPLAQRAYRAVRGAFDPSQASNVARTTALQMRKARGLNQLDADRAGYALEKLDKRMQFSAQDHDGLRGFYAFMENRSRDSGAKGAGAILQGAAPLSADEAALAKRYGLTTKEIKAANQFRDIYQGYADKAEKIVKANTGSTPQFIKDYYAHMWQQPEEEVGRKMDAWASRQGSGVNLRKRAIPTIEDGIAMGLTPKYGPVQTTQLYATNMSRFLTTNENQAFLKSNGYASWHRPGKQPDGWVPLDGIMTERVPKGGGGGRRPKGPTEEPHRLLLDQRGQVGTLPGRNALAVSSREVGRGLNEIPGDPALGDGRSLEPGRIEDAAANAQQARVREARAKREKKLPVGDQAVQKEKLYARPDVARLYNNEISQGFRTGQGPLETVAHYAHRVAMADMLYKFAFSAYHLTNVSVEAVANRISNAAQNLSRGEPVKAAARLSAAPFSPILDTARGQLMRQELRGDAAATPFGEKINAAFVKAGGKLNMDRDYRATGSRTFYDSLKNRTFKADFAREAQRVYGRDVVMRDRAKAAFDIASNVMTSFSGVLFEDIIPQMKMGAFANNYGDWLKKFPNATEAEQQEYAARLLDSLDNRQGELIRDNMFWKKKTQEVAQIAMLAPTFKIGTWRELLGGLHDIPESVRGIASGKGITPRTAYALVGLPLTVALANETAQYLKTGKGAESPRDLMAYRTGGKDPRLGGAPERGLIPGNVKDVYEIAGKMHPGSGGIPSYAYNSLSDLAKVTTELAQNRDYADHPIYGPGARKGAAADYAANIVSPISLSTFDQGALKGSKLSTTERVLGVRSAPVSVSNPEALARVRGSVARREAKSATRAEMRREQNYPALKPAAKVDAAPAWAQETPSWAQAPIKQGADNAGSIQPIFQPVVDLVRSLPGVRDIGALNDSYHSAGDVHGQGRAADVSLVSGRSAAPAFIAALKEKLKAQGITNVKITDEYAHPSARATAGHVHIEMDQ